MTNISKAAKSAKSELDRIPDKVSTTLDVDCRGWMTCPAKLGDLPGLVGDIAGKMAGPGGIAAAGRSGRGRRVRSGARLSPTPPSKPG